MIQNPNKDLAISTLWGGAVADAIGNPLEFRSLVLSADVDKVLASGVLHPSDDTQMTLFNYEALLHGWSPKDAAVSWYGTQRRPFKKQTAPKTGLLSFPTMYRVEAPGNTCMASCASLSVGAPVTNDSKGNGTVMRAAPFAVMAYLRGQADEMAFLGAKEDAEMTHKHPAAALSSVALASILLNLFRGTPLPVAVLQGLHVCGHGGLLDVVSSMHKYTTYSELRSQGRAGWIAEEALALAIGANLHAPQTYKDIVSAACTGISVDSDTVAGIAGTIAAARGMPATPELCKRLYSADAIQYIDGLIRNLSE